MKFCKLFETEEHGQVLVFKDVGESGAPQLKMKFYADPVGIATILFDFSNDPEGVENFDKALENIDDVWINESVESVKADLRKETES